jgi:uncharacterized protein (DUF4415 family)
MIAWDEAKRKRNLKDHGIDLAEVACVLSSMPRWSRWKTNVGITANSGCKVWAGFATTLSSWYGRSAMTAPESFPVVTVINMKRAPTSKHPECPYDPNDAASVNAFWAKGKVRLPGQRGPQKQPTKVAVTVRYSPEVLEYFRATGEGWQTRMNDALRAYVKRHRTA